MSRRYIDADKLVEFCDEMSRNNWNQRVSPASWADAYESFIDDIDEQPTADVVKVRHGEWIYHECVASYDGCISGYSCSVCNAFVEDEYFEAEEYHKNFCGNCGAKMDGGSREKK